MTGQPEDPPRTWPAVALLLLAGLFAYCNCFTKAFVFDDGIWILTNSALEDPVAFMRSEWAYTRPLISWSLLLNYQLGGLHPFGYHLLNVAIHLTAGVLLFAVIRRAVAGPWPEAALDIAFAASLLWLVHPLQTQSVTYIIQRCESMMGMFFLLSVYCALRGLDSARPRTWHLGAVLSALASGSCKEVAPAIPLVVLAYDWVFVPGPFLPTLRRRWPLYLGLFAATWGVLIGLNLLPSSTPVSAGFAYKGISSRDYLFTQPGVLLHYLRLSVWPYPQALDYIGWPLAKSPAEWAPQGLAIVALLVFTFWALWRRWWPGFLGAWFFFILGPTSSIVPIADVAFEHRMYLSLASLTVLAAVAGRALLPPGYREMALIVVAAALTAATLLRNEAYRAAYDLWVDNARVTPRNTRVLTNVAAEARQLGRLDEALRWLDEAERVNPNDRWLPRQRGLVYLHLGRFAEAAAGADLARDRARYHTQTQAAIRRLSGQAALLMGPHGLPAAEEAFREAVRLTPLDPRLRLPLALTLAARGQADEAETHRAEAVRLEPGIAEVHERASRLSSLARPPEDAGRLRSVRATAILDARLAVLATREREARPLDTLGIALAADGRFKEAADAAARAIALSPADAGVALRLGLYRQGKPYTRENARAAGGKKP